MPALDVLPCNSVPYRIDRPLGHPELFCKFTFGLTKSVSTYFTNFGFSEFGLAVGLTFSLSIFRNLISYIIELCTLKQMIWVYARRVIATVTNENGWYKEFVFENLP